MLHAGIGKNASDILLALDAMELLLSKNIRCFVIASSDGDFSHLATRLREQGAKVVGIGETKAPSAFRACCNKFVEIGAARPVRIVPEPTATVTTLDLQIRSTIASHSQNGAGLRITELASKLHVQHGVQISKYPERSWPAYLVARPSLYELDPRGIEAKVRFRPEAFSKAA